MLQGYRMIISYNNKSPPHSLLLLLLMLLPGFSLIVMKFLLYMDTVGRYELVLLWIIWAIGIQYWFFIKEQISPPLSYHTESSKDFSNPVA
jgi:hypothetical protein